MADRQKDKGRLSERVKESPLGRWPTAFLYRGEEVTEAEETPSPFLLLLELTPLVTERSGPFFPLSQLTDCHSQISSLAPSVPVGLYPFLTFIVTDRDKRPSRAALGTSTGDNYSDLKT